MLLEYLMNHPMYLIFLVLNAWVIWRIVRVSTRNSDDEDSDKGNDGNVPLDDPILDLPPGITLPVPEEDLEPELYQLFYMVEIMVYA